jgi:hypothetical protein
MQLLDKRVCVSAKRSPRRQMLIQLESGEKIFIPVSHVHGGEKKIKKNNIKVIRQFGAVM